MPPRSTQFGAQCGGNRRSTRCSHLRRLTGGSRKLLINPSEPPITQCRLVAAEANRPKPPCLPGVGLPVASRSRSIDQSSRPSTLRSTFDLLFCGGAMGTRTPLQNLQRQPLSWGGCGIALLGRLSASGGYASVCYAT